MRHLKLVSSQASVKESAQLKIAFASSDRHTVNQHFGAAQAFVVFNLSQGHFQLAEVVEFSGESVLQDGQEGKLEAKVRLLESCAAVYCNAVGASAIRQLLAENIQPLKVEPGTVIENLLKDLQQLWDQEPPVWLERSLRQQQRPAERFAGMADQDWQQEEWH